MSSIRIIDFASEDLQKVALIFSEYAEELGVDLSFQNFTTELQTLPDIYGLPAGAIWLAEGDTGDVVGCVALKPLKEPGCCELKRLFVKPEYRSSGLGVRLLETAIDFARTQGYATLKLDSLERLQSALRLYEKLGFQRTDAYVYNPDPQAVYLALAL